MNRIKFTKLFGRFNYDILLKDDGITIITGPNGFGKSTILRTIEAVQNGIEGILYFINLDFERVEFFFENDDSVIIKKDIEKLYINNSSINVKEFARGISRIVYRYGPYLRHLNDDIFLDRRSGKEYSIDELLSDKSILKDIFEKQIPLDEIISQTIISKLKKLKEKIGNIFFIKEQRLLIDKSDIRRQEEKVINIIDELPEKFKKQIGEICEKYSKVANEYDSTYPYRLFSEKNKISKDEYEESMREIKKKFKKLKEYDISDINSNKKIEFNDDFATALKIYIEDFNNKYKVYEELINKLDLYIRIVNNRLMFKKIRISREYGIEVISDSQKKLRLSELSSGEQQEIVLFYQLIFETPNQSLLLIDEPEISLHIIWQKIFMNDLQEVVNLKNLNVIVATHSPQIISNHLEKQIDLGSIYSNEFNNR